MSHRRQTAALPILGLRGVFGACVALVFSTSRVRFTTTCRPVGAYTDGSDFTLSRNESERITSTVLSLLKEGKLTKEPCWERCWVGAFMVRRLVTALFKDALFNGTINWDVTISKALAIVMVAALTARAGDVTMAPLDEQRRPFLCYKDITLQLVGVTRLENLKARCLIRNEKGDK
jgi:hypothetical protein